MQGDQPYYTTFEWADTSPPQFKDARRAMAYAKVYSPEMLGKLIVALENECPNSDEVVKHVLDHYGWTETK